MLVCVASALSFSRTLLTKIKTVVGIEVCLDIVTWILFSFTLLMLFFVYNLPVLGKYPGI